LIRSLETRLHYRPRGIDHPPCADTSEREGTV
jgi:hypothetical protein